MPELSLEDQFEATLNWTDSEDLLPGRTYLFYRNNQQALTTVTKLKYRIDSGNIKSAANILTNGETGVVNLALDNNFEISDPAEADEPIAFELLDANTNKSVAKGIINHRLRRATNIRWQNLDIDKNARATIKQQKPCVIWFTGFSGSGKSTIANLVEKRLYGQNMHSYLLDGDNVRHGLNKDLGFTDADRVENIRRIAETAKLMVDAGLIVLTSFISPFQSERRMARDLLDTDEFIEVFVDTPLAVCEDRDPKGLYKKVRAGQIKNFTGFDSPYEPPENPELHIDTTALSADAAAEQIVDYILNR